MRWTGPFRRTDQQLTRMVRPAAARIEHTLHARNYFQATFGRCTVPATFTSSSGIAVQARHDFGKRTAEPVQIRKRDGRNLAVPK